MWAQQQKQSSWVLGTLLCPEFEAARNRVPDSATREALSNREATCEP